MRTLKFLLRKEFRQIFRDKSIVALIFIMPVIQLIVMPLAADYEVRNINLAVVDNDKSPYSQKLISKVIASGYFRLQGYNDSFNEAFTLIESDEADLILEIPHGFERNLIREDKQKLFVAVNAINGTKANLGGSYLNSIIGSFNADIRMQLVQQPRFSQFPMIEVVASNWFNPVLNYKLFIVPGILAILVTMVGGFLSALNIVKEKEIGTIEQINVTPIKKHIFILGKLIPFWVLANIVFTIGLLLARFIYGIVPIGSLLVLYVFISLFTCLPCWVLDYWYPLIAIPSSRQCLSCSFS
jgi:ABC-2 type transport system permease protein